MAISPLPPAPQHTDPPPIFESKGDLWVAALETWTNQANALQVDVNNKQTAAAANQVAAELAETNAETARDLSIANATGTTTDGSSKLWATKTGSAVAASEFSAKEYAIGTVATVGSAKTWATKTGSVVVTGEYSAKEHAVGTVATTGSAKDWASKAENSEVTTGEYSAKHYSLKTAILKSSVEATAAAVQSAAGLPSLTGNAFKSLCVNSAATGVEWSGGVTPGCEYITASKTFVVPSEVKLLFVQVWGPGGGGGAAQSYYPPGGGGGYSEKYIAVTPGQSIVATVGVGGLGATYVYPNTTNGVTGTTTSFGSYLSATGGEGGGISGETALGRGGTGVGGSMNVKGGQGLNGVIGGTFMMHANIETSYAIPAKSSMGLGGWPGASANGRQGGDGMIIVRWYK